MNTYIQEQPQGFIPSAHLIQLKSKQGAQDYLPVQWRLVWFREYCPEGSIETELIHFDPDRETTSVGYEWNEQARRSEKVTKRANGFAMFKATVRDGKGGVASAHGSEGAADFADYVEKAETKAIGRALAELGYGTQFAPDLDEQHRIVDAPVTSDTKSDPTPTPAHAQPAKQDKGVQGMIETARARCEKLGLDWEEFKAEAIGYNIADRELIVTSFVKINGLLTKKEDHAA